MRMSLPAVVSILVLGVSPLAADHWPQWRGPTLNGESERGREDRGADVPSAAIVTVAEF